MEAYLPASPSSTGLTVSPDLVGQAVWFGDDARRSGIHLMGGPGSGKSRALGRLLAWIDFLRGSPQVVLDPTGGTIDNFLDRLILQPPAVQELLWPRVRYVDLGASDSVTPMPLYRRRHAQESWFAVANRPLEIFRRIDPHLATASVEGWNALFEAGIYAGQLAAALGLQVTEVADLLRQPKRWKIRCETLRATYTDLEPALEYLREYARLKPELQRRRTGSLLTKLLPFLADPAMQATFAADREGISIPAVDHECLTLLVDGRHERDPVRRQFKLLWLFRLVTDYLKERGMAGRARPLGFIIDEVTQLLGFHSLENTVMAEDLEELVSVVARNYGCNLTIAHQSLTQIAGERIRNVLMQMGTQIIGLVHNPDDREYLARHFFRYDAYKVKKEEPVWMNVQYGIGPYSGAAPKIIDHTTTEFTAEEQLIAVAERFRTLDRFCFLVRRAAGEGAVANALQEVSIAQLDAGRYPDEEQLAVARRQLCQRDGFPVDDLLAEIRSRTRRALAEQPLNAHAILDTGEELTDEPTGADRVPVPNSPAAAAAQKTVPPDGWRDDLWRHHAP
ncbi:MAG: type IV secretion system DNA-binding domain-containing protein [Caldilineaceae bacterium]|nr:type IV secretion system DNA-binding domain-containing protein [Caldilineaceae bacterium]